MRNPNIKKATPKPRVTKSSVKKTGPKQRARQAQKSTTAGNQGYKFMQQGYYPKQRYQIKSQSDQYDTIIQLSGEDYLDPLVLQNRSSGAGSGARVKRGSLVYELDFNPTMMSSPVMQKYSSMYQQFRFKSICIEYKPEVPVTTQGAVLAVAHHDPTDTPPEAFGNSNIEYATSKAATFSQLFNPFAVRWTPRENKWYYCVSTQADVAEEIAGKYLIFALGSPVLETDPDIHDVTFGSLFVRYEVEFKDLLIRDKTDESQIDIYYDGGTVAPGAGITLYATTNKTVEAEELADGEIDELLVEMSGQTSLADSGAAEGNVCFTTTDYTLSADRQGAVLASIAVQLFLNLADVFVGNLMKNLGSGNIVGDNTQPIMHARRAKLNPVRINATVDSLVLDNKKVLPRYEKLVRESMERLKDKHPDAVARYIATHMSGVDSTPAWAKSTPSPVQTPTQLQIMNPRLGNGAGQEFQYRAEYL